MRARFRARSTAGMLGLGALALVVGALPAGGLAAWRDPWWGAGLVLWAGALATAVALALLGRGLARGDGLTAVAAVLVVETVRRRVALVATALLLLGIALLPLLLASNEVLEYRLRSFLGYGLFLTFLSLAVLTVFGASASLCEEIVDRRIHLLVVKPTSRARLLIGKWLGLVLLDALLLAVAGGAISGSFHLQLAAARADGVDTAAAERLLRARSDIPAELPAGLVESLDERAAARRAGDPEAWLRRLAEAGGDEAGAMRQLRIDIFRTALTQARVVPAGERRTFEYRLPDGPTAEGTTLRLQPYLGREHASQRIRLVVSIDGTPNTVFIGGGEATELPVSAAATADGVVSVSIENPREEGRPEHTANFLGRDGMRLVVVGGPLEGNLLRALLILLFQLSFLAALGLAAGTFLGLPVAVLLVLLVLFAAVGGGVFLGDADDAVRPAAAAHDHDHDHAHDHVRPSPFLTAVDSLGRAFVGLFAAWGRSPAVTPVSEGREIPLEDLGRAALWIGLVWTGAVGLGGVLVFRRREIARVQV